ncbi:MAG: hypothetical protein DRI90_06240 [Deltaproteobacteria bacterium]|nr:MAG: hypothetical protein DRI90_06240 [Deltaproteobacteria bacterium]
MAHFEPRWLLAVGVLLTAPTLTACAELTRSDPFVVIKELPKPPPVRAQVAPGSNARAAGSPAGKPKARRSGG